MRRVGGGRLGDRLGRARVAGWAMRVSATCCVLAAAVYGARAVLIDKDGAPKWRPSRIEDVTPAMVDDYFGPLGADELVLPTRAEMLRAPIRKFPIPRPW